MGGTLLWKKPGPERMFATMETKTIWHPLRQG
jgi:hypothetical protein